MHSGGVQRQLGQEKRTGRTEKRRNASWVRCGKWSQREGEQKWVVGAFLDGWPVLMCLQVSQSDKEPVHLSRNALYIG